MEFRFPFGCAFGDERCHGPDSSPGFPPFSVSFLIPAAHHNQSSIKAAKIQASSARWSSASALRTRTRTRAASALHRFCSALLCSSSLVPAWFLFWDPALLISKICHFLSINCCCGWAPESNSPHRKRRTFFEKRWSRTLTSLLISFHRRPKEVWENKRSGKKASLSGFTPRFLWLA